MKALVLYYSKTGNTRHMAEVIAAGMGKVAGVEAKACSIEDVDEAWALESKCIILGSPIYCSNVSAAVKTFLDSSFKKYRPAGKLGGAFATMNYIYGGAELGIRLILDHMLVFGMLTYSGGGACGMPVIHLGPAALGTKLEESEPVFALYGERMAKKAVELFA